jgi:hypothetical protein
MVPLLPVVWSVLIPGCGCLHPSLLFPGYFVCQGRCQGPVSPMFPSILRLQLRSVEV